MLKEIKKRRQHYFKDEQGRRQGVYKEWHKNMFLSLQKHVVNDINHGKCEAWYDNGNPLYTCFYVNGQVHGECKEYLDNGLLIEHCFYVNDYRHGEYKLWEKDGTLKRHCFYVNGNEVSFNIIPLPTNDEELIYFKLKYDLPLLPVEELC